jgi:hypothetical protein
MNEITIGVRVVRLKIFDNYSTIALLLSLACMLSAEFRSQKFSGWRFFDLGMITKCTEKDSSASIAYIIIYAVQTPAGSLAVMLT